MVSQTYHIRCSDKNASIRVNSTIPHCPNSAKYRLQMEEYIVCVLGTLTLGLVLVERVSVMPKLFAN